MAIILRQWGVTMESVKAAVSTDIDDARFGRIVAMGTLVGVPLVFVVSVLMALPGAGWPLAAGVAVWPALVGGPFFGGFVALMRAMTAHEHRASVDPDLHPRTEAPPGVSGRVTGSARRCMLPAPSGRPP